MIKAISFVIKKESLGFLEFRNHYETIHAPLATKLLNPPFYERNYVYRTFNGNPEIGSISIFKYPDMIALNKVNTILKSTEAIPLRDDELKFMEPHRNYFYLVDEKIINHTNDQEKIFIVVKELSNFVDLGESVLSENYYEKSVIIECTSKVALDSLIHRKELEIYLCSSNPNDQLKH